LGKKLYIKTYGCQMNAYDSARMADVLAPLGFSQTADPAGADMAIVNTCHIREKATDKLFADLGRLRTHQAAKAAAGGRMMIAVAGCVAQAEGAEIRRRAPFVDIVVGPQTYHRLPEFLARVMREARAEHAGRDGGGVLATDFPAEAKFDALPARSPGGGAARNGKLGVPGTPGGVSAYLTVQEGCDKFCTFCVVPYTRGAEFSRPAASVLAEARHLAAGGASEIVVLGQNVNAYHGQGPDGESWSLGRLFRALAEIDGVRRLRYMTSHPLEVDDDLAAAHRDVAELMPFVHLPAQSGSDRILAAMNRRYDVAGYRRAIDRLRRARPDLAVSSDFIVGFPGETDADFTATLNLARAAGFAQAYAFKYSPRPGTPAAMMPNQVPETLKAQRLAELLAVVAEQQLAFNRAFEGQDVPVLLDRPGRRPGQLHGRSPHMQAVHAAAPPAMIGCTVMVRIEQALSNSLAGRVADSPRGATN
jgi:tRNA-2-methylthio-N6-dimethylallyladenosine synthase